MESKLLQTKDIGDFFSVTVCYFGSFRLGERPWARAFPAEIALGYLCQSRHAPRTTADAPDPKSWVRYPG
jgi:hypothetical protein